MTPRAPRSPSAPQPRTPIPKRLHPRCSESSTSPSPPLRVFFGDYCLPMIKREYAERIATWERWNDVSLEAQGNLANR